MHVLPLIALVEAFLVKFLGLQALMVEVFFFFFVVDGHLVPFADGEDVRQHRRLLERFSLLGHGIAECLRSNTKKQGTEDT